MNESAHNALELDEILERLERLAATSGGRLKARGLTPSSEIGEVRRRLHETSEARRLHDERQSLSLAGLPEIGPALDELRIAGRALEVSSFLLLLTFAEKASGTRALLTPRADLLPELAAVASRIGDFSELTAAIRRVIDRETEDVRDDASETLSALRAKSRRARARIAKIMDAAVGSRDNQKILQEAIVTSRNDRPVVPIRAECKAQFPGIVHGASSSGATLFVEPMAAVPLGNELAALRDREKAEVRRILLVLTDRSREAVPELSETAELLAELDFIEARAYLSESYRGEHPTVTESEVFRLDEARHPLLAEPVPLSFGLDEERRGLVFTGPNTGGKTVALKTAGLLALMVQSGLHVPARSSSTFPVFRSVFADIGDDQSIGASLSTFSSHLARVVAIERELERPALVILDEVGTGTDPAEGGALGAALVEHFLGRGALLLASTHHGLLKAYALTTLGIEAASFDFDPKTYQPTYHIVLGAAGRSLAFEMAERLGLPRGIVRRARELQGDSERQVSELVSKLEAEGAEIERERAALTDARERLERDRSREKGERRRRAEAFRASLREELEQTRAELGSLVSEAKEAVAEIRSSRREESKRLADLERKIAERLERAEAEADARARAETEEDAEGERPKKEEIPLRPGLRVLVASFGMEGEILSLSGAEAEVLVRDKKLRLPVSKLEALPQKPRGAPSGEPRPAGSVSAVSVHVPGGKTVPESLNLLGCTVEEALEKADKFLDDALLSEYRHVRLIHGHGTGRLKRALSAWLSEHPHVEGQLSENRGGVTVVELKD